MSSDSEVMASGRRVWSCPGKDYRVRSKSAKDRLPRTQSPRGNYRAVSPGIDSAMEGCELVRESQDHPL